MKNLKLGIIGMSDGNGHPYSWSAIFNGYNLEEMARCPFPVIPEYLGREKFPEAQIPGTAVTHIWTQSLELSRQIAAASCIPHVTENMEQMIPQVDGILLARDDAENHLSMAEVFLKAGLPIYIDKPLAFCVADAVRIFSLEKYRGQIFTCSAFQYAKEFQVSPETLESLGPIRSIEAQVKKNWKKYAIHMIEPIVKIIGFQRPLLATEKMKTLSETTGRYSFDNDLMVTVTTSEVRDLKPMIRLVGEKSETTLVFHDTYSAFKNALEVFITGMREKKAMIDPNFVLRCIEMVEVAE